MNNTANDRPTEPSAPAKSEITNVLERLDQLTNEQREACLWRTLGGVEWMLENKPHARLAEFVEILAGHIVKYEKQRDLVAA